MDRFSIRICFFKQILDCLLLCSLRRGAAAFEIPDFVSVQVFHDGIDPGNYYYLTKFIMAVRE